MEAKDLSKLEADERRKVDEVLRKAQVRKKIIKEKVIAWMKRHPIFVGIVVVLMALQFVNAYYKMDRLHRKAEAQANQEMWRRALETK